MAKQVTNKDIFNDDLFTKTVDEAKKLKKVLDELEKGFIEVAKAQQKIVNSQDNKSLDSIQKTKNAVKELNETEKASLKIQQQKKSLAVQLKIANSEANKQNVQNKLLIQEQIKDVKNLEKAKLKNLGVIKKTTAEINKEIAAAKKQRKSTADSANAFKVLTKQVNSAQSRFKRLAAQYGETDDRTQKALSTFRRLDNQLRSINKTARDGRRDVGRYGLALSNVGASLKSLVFAGGVVGAIRGVGRAIGDAFERVRAFDKELQNISGVTGIARKDLKSLEKSIIDVAGSSIKTSNEVAQLASTLFTLGNSEREVKLLLKPVNDLSIALGATSEEAADFLGQTLNAFGKGADSGQEFADIIANVRTSTSLDFQRIKDALGFVAPTANALGLSLGTVSAQIGVLQDNGIKAARAGRLLNTSFARLIEKGLTLDEALLKVNSSQDKVATSVDLFGKESFTLGLILADNVDKTAALANEFDNLSEGSLKTLTDEQLKSMDAQLKILDSTYEKFILNIENGNGVISDIFKGFIKGAIDAVDRIDKLSVSLGNFTKRTIGARAGIISTFEDISGFQTDIGLALSKGNEAIEKETDRIAKEFVTKDRKTQRTIADNLVNRIREDIKSLKGASVAEGIILERRIGANQLLISKLEIVNDEVKEGTDVLNLNTGATNKNEKAKTGLTGVIEKQSKAVSDLNEKIKRASTEELVIKLSLELDDEKEELDRLNRIVNSSLEEAQKIEIDLIEDQTEKRIALEELKSKKLIKQIQSNSRIEQSVKDDLIRSEDERLIKFTEDQEIKKLKSAIDFEADLARAEFEQKRTGFNTQEEFEEEKAEQFKAIKRNQLQAELDLLKFSGREEDELRVAQLKAQLEGLNDIGKGFEKLKGTIGDVVQVIGEVIDDAFDKRIAKIGEQLDKTGENIDRLRTKANEGQLDSEESLAFEQKQEIELARQQEREQKRQARTQAFFSVLSSFQSNDGNLTKTIADISVLRALAGGLTAFDGVDDTGPRGDVDSKGGKIWTLHPNEQVHSLRDRKDMKDPNTGKLRSRNELKDIVSLHDSGLMNDLMKHDGSNEFMNPSAFVLNGMDTSKIESKLDKLNQSIKSIQPITGSVEINEAKKIIQYTYKKGNRVTKEVSKLF